MANALWYFIVLPLENLHLPLLYMWGSKDSGLHRFCAKYIIVLAACREAMSVVVAHHFFVALASICSSRRSLL